MSASNQISVEPVLTVRDHSYHSFGKYLYENRNSSSDVHAIINFDTGDDLPSRCMKRMLQDMTGLHHNHRPMIEEIEFGIRGKYPICIWFNS